MGFYADFDEGIAGRRSAEDGSSLALQAQGLAIFSSRRNGKFQRLAVGERQAPFDARRSFDQIRLGGIGDIGASNPDARTLAAEEIREQLILEITDLAIEAAISRTPIALGVVLVEGAPRPFGTGGVDLAAIEAGPHFRITQQIMGGGDFLE